MEAGLHPILFYITDSFYISTYGLLIAAGLLVSCALAAWRGRRRGLPAEAFFDLAMVAVVSGFVGARILFILTEWNTFLADPMSLILSRDGFVFLGGLLAAVPACVWFVRRRGLDMWKMADVVAPSIAIGHAFGRIGCHLSGCCFGGVCTMPIGMAVPAQALRDGTLWYNAYSDQLSRGVVGPGDAFSLPVWPVQLMEAGALFLLAGVLIWMATGPVRRGRIFGLYLAGYSVIRFALEYLRGDAERGLYLNGMISTSQIISILTFAAGVWVVWSSKDREPYDPVGTPEPETGVAARRRRRREAAAGSGGG